MKELEQKADEMLRQNGHYADFYRVEKADIHLAIQSVSHTIETLEKQKERFERNGLFESSNHIEYELNRTINEQIELKKILENRL